MAYNSMISRFISSNLTSRSRTAVLTVNFWRLTRGTKSNNFIKRNVYGPAYSIHFLFGSAVIVHNRSRYVRKGIVYSETTPLVAAPYTEKL